jgi:hypothetical protein
MLDPALPGLRRTRRVQQRSVHNRSATGVPRNRRWSQSCQRSRVVPRPRAMRVAEYHQFVRDKCADLSDTRVETNESSRGLYLRNQSSKFVEIRDQPTKHHQVRHCHARVCVQPHHVINSVNLRGRDRAFGDSPIHHVSCLIGLSEQIRPVHGQLVSQHRYRLTTFLIRWPRRRDSRSPRSAFGRSQQLLDGRSSETDARLCTLRAATAIRSRMAVWAASRSLFGSERRSVARTVGSHSYHDLEATVGTAGRVSWLTSIIIACL